MERKKVIETKKEILNKVLRNLEDSTIFLQEQIKQIRQMSIEAPGRMQSRHDSSKQELSYLLDGTHKRLKEIQESIRILEEFKVSGLSVFDQISVGSLIQLKEEDKEEFYFILPVGGGNRIKTEEFGTITIISVFAPLSKILMGKTVGDFIIVDSKKIEIILVF